MAWARQQSNSGCCTGPTTLAPQAAQHQAQPTCWPCVTSITSSCSPCNNARGAVSGHRGGGACVAQRRRPQGAPCTPPATAAHHPNPRRHCPPLGGGAHQGARAAQPTSSPYMQHRQGAPNLGHQLVVWEDVHPGGPRLPAGVQHAHACGGGQAVAVKCLRGTAGVPLGQADQHRWGPPTPGSSMRSLQGRLYTHKLSGCGHAWGLHQHGCRITTHQMSAHMSAHTDTPTHQSSRAGLAPAHPPHPKGRAHAAPGRPGLAAAPRGGRWARCPRSARGVWERVNGAGRCWLAGEKKGCGARPGAAARGEARESGVERV